MKESAISNTSYTIRDSNRSQRLAIIERPRTNASYAIRDSDGG